MLLIPGVLVLPLLQPFDQQWTVWLQEHGSKEFGLWMGRTMFEGKLPGASDPAIIFLLDMVLGLSTLLLICLLTTLHQQQ